MEERQFDDIRPDSRTRRATGATDQLQLSDLLSSLEDGLLHEELTKNTPVTVTQGQHSMLYSRHSGLDLILIVQVQQFFADH